MQQIKMSLLTKCIIRSLLPIIALSSGAVCAKQFDCADLALIEINSSDEYMINDICNASGKAVSFLAQYNLYPKRVIKIQIIDSIINNDGYIAFGSYDRQIDLIQLMSLPAILDTTESPEMYDQPFDREHYRGVIAHEIVHAIFHHNSRNIKEQLTNVAQEYLAHTVQLGVLSPERRNQILGTNDLGPWESGDSISVTYMGLRPTGFAVKSYLHFTQMSDPLPFIQILLNNNWFFISVP
ncbi:MAG: DUF6639 family protein [Desulforhopalus sp.]